jgi:hypothetical protein
MYLEQLSGYYGMGKGYYIELSTVDLQQVERSQIPGIST